MLRRWRRALTCVIRRREGQRCWLRGRTELNCQLVKKWIFPGELSLNLIQMGWTDVLIQISSSNGISENISHVEAEADWEGFHLSGREWQSWVGEKRCGWPTQQPVPAFFSTLYSSDSSTSSSINDHILFQKQKARRREKIGVKWWLCYVCPLARTSRVEVFSIWRTVCSL